MSGFFPFDVVQIVVNFSYQFVDDMADQMYNEDIDFSIWYIFR